MEPKSTLENKELHDLIFLYMRFPLCVLNGLDRFSLFQFSSCPPLEKTFVSTLIITVAFPGQAQNDFVSKKET